MSTVRVLLFISGKSKMEFNVKNLFLQETLEEEVYMSLSPDHRNENNKRLACKLHKAIYGLKHRPVHGMKLYQILLELGFFSKVRPTHLCL